MPKETFEFGEALNRLRAGKFVARAGWNGKGQRLGMQVPDEQSANSLPYIYIITVDGNRVPWVASHTDMLGSDWHDVEVGGVAA